MIERKLSAQVLVELQAMGNGHMALALPIQGQLALQLPDPCAGQTLAPPGAWVLAKDLIGYDSPSAT